MGRFTCSVPGVYFFAYSMSGPNNVVTIPPSGLNASIVLNGSTSLAQAAFPGDDFTSPQVSISSLVQCSIGDTVVCLVAFIDLVSAPFTLNFSSVFAYLVAT